MVYPYLHEGTRNSFDSERFSWRILCRTHRRKFHNGNQRFDHHILGTGWKNFFLLNIKSSKIEIILNQIHCTHEHPKMFKWENHCNSTSHIGSKTNSSRTCWLIVAVKPLMRLNWTWVILLVGHHLRTIANEGNLNKKQKNSTNVAERLLTLTYTSKPFWGLFMRAIVCLFSRRYQRVGPNYEKTLETPLLWREGLVGFFLIRPTLW